MAIRLTAAANDFDNLPTFFKWKKATEIKAPAEFIIVKVLWNSEFRSVTFFTEVFRYNVKLESDEVFEKQCKALKTQMCKYCYAAIKVNEDSHEVFIDKVGEASSDFQQFEWFDWGLTLKKTSR